MMTAVPACRAWWPRRSGGSSEALRSALVGGLVFPLVGDRACCARRRTPCGVGALALGRGLVGRTILGTLGGTAMSKCESSFDWAWLDE